MSVFVVFPKYLTMHVYHILLDAMFDGFRRHVLYECNSAATVFDHRFIYCYVFAGSPYLSQSLPDCIQWIPNFE